MNGKIKNWTTKRLLHGLLWHKTSPTGDPIQGNRQIDQITRHPIIPLMWPSIVLSWFFPLQNFLSRKLRDFILRNKALVSLLTCKILQAPFSIHIMGLRFLKPLS